MKRSVIEFSTVFWVLRDKESDCYKSSVKKAEDEMSNLGLDGTLRGIAMYDTDYFIFEKPLKNWNIGSGFVKIHK